MLQKYFNFTDVIGYGWRVAISNIGFFIGLFLLYIVIIYLPSVAEITIRHVLPPEVLTTLLVVAIQILGYFVSLVMAIGLIKIALAVCSEQKPPFSTLFSAAGCFWRYLGTAILYGLIIIAGVLLFIVPGIIWAVKFQLCFYFVIDKGMGPVEALKASSKATMGLKWHLFGFGMLCGIINYLGILCLVVGVFVTAPLTIVAKALVYRQLAAQTDLTTTPQQPAV